MTHLWPTHECIICPEEDDSVKSGRSVILAETKVSLLSILQSPTAKDFNQTHRETDKGGGKWQHNLRSQNAGS